MFHRWCQLVFGKAADGTLVWLAEGILVWLVLGLHLMFWAVEAGVLWMMLWGWNLVLGRGTVWGHTDFMSLIGAVAFFRLIENRRTCTNRGHRRLRIYLVEVALVIGGLKVGPWLDGRGAEIPLSVIIPVSVCYVAVMVALEDVGCWLERRRKEFDKK